MFRVLLRDPRLDEMQPVRADLDEVLDAIGRGVAVLDLLHEPLGGGPDIGLGIEVAMSVRIVRGRGFQDRTPYLLLLLVELCDGHVGLPA